MGVESQETRSLPRNRKCGNCRFYEPAPLWRKGWCRNPKLYPPHANHLVDATTIDCEGGFRSRIYWEPLPQPEAPARPPTQIYRVQAAPSPPVTPPPPPVVEPAPISQFAVPAERMEVIPASPIPPEAEAKVGPTGPRPPGLGPGKDWRTWTRQRLPFTAKWPLEKVVFNQQTLVALGVGLLVGFVLLMLLLSNLGKKSQEEAAQLATQSTVNAAVQATATAQVTAAQAFSTATAQALAQPQVTPTPTKPPLKAALVKGTGSTPLNVREEANLKGKLVTTIKEGEKVTILEGPKDSDGRGWYRIEYNGKSGWAAKDYLQLLT